MKDPAPHGQIKKPREETGEDFMVSERSQGLREYLRDGLEGVTVGIHRMEETPKKNTEVVAKLLNRHDDALCALHPEPALK